MTCQPSFSNKSLQEGRAKNGGTFVKSEELNSDKGFEAYLEFNTSLTQKAFKTIAISKTVPRKDESKKPCYWYTGRGHTPGECHFKEVECQVCKKRSHIAEACKSQPMVFGWYF